MGKCNERLFKITIMVKMSMKVAIFHVDSKEKCTLAISCLPVNSHCVHADMIITKITRGDNVRIMGQNQDSR